MDLPRDIIDEYDVKCTVALYFFPEVKFLILYSKTFCSRSAERHETAVMVGQQCVPAAFPLSSDLSAARFPDFPRLLGFSQEPSYPPAIIFQAIPATVFQLIPTVAFPEAGLVVIIKSYPSARTN